MAVDQDLDLLTIAEAAKLLKVSRITLHRWLKAGRLSAYHVGPKAVRIRRGDLATVMTPLARPAVTTMKDDQTQPMQTLSRPLTDEEIARGLAALAQAKAHTDAMLAARGGQPLAESWPLIREEREARSLQQP
jgi:excisionase family DNA binding protein